MCLLADADLIFETMRAAVGMLLSGHAVTAVACARTASVGDCCSSACLRLYSRGIRWNTPYAGHDCCTGGPGLEEVQEIIIMEHSHCGRAYYGCWRNAGQFWPLTPGSPMRLYPTGYHSLWLLPCLIRSQPESRVDAVLG